MKSVIPLNERYEYSCLICNKDIKTVIDYDPRTGEEVLIPSSLYWNSEKEKAYCSPECSLIDHEKKEKINAGLGC